MIETARASYQHSKTPIEEKKTRQRKLVDVGNVSIPSRSRSSPRATLFYIYISPALHNRQLAGLQDRRSLISKRQYSYQYANMACPTSRYSTHSPSSMPFNGPLLGARASWFRLTIAKDHKFMPPVVEMPIPERQAAVGSPGLRLQPYFVPKEAAFWGLLWTV